METKKEYKIVLYSTITNEEKYEYFASKKNAIQYAKKMADDTTQTNVWLFEYTIENGKYINEKSECIWES